MNTCPYCTQELPQEAHSCSFCGGQITSSPENPSVALLGDELDPNPIDSSQQMYYYIPTGKFIILSVLSCSLYQLYWFYKNWCLIRDGSRVKIRPAWRALFAIFFSYSFFFRLLTSAGLRGVRKKASFLALLYAGMILLEFLPSPWGYLEVLNVIPLAYASRYIYEVNSSGQPGDWKNHRMNWVQICLVMLGIFFWAAVILDEFKLL